MLGNAQLIGLTKQMALQRQMDVLSNNLANINTTGFKTESLLFEEYAMPLARDNSFPRPDQPLSYVQDWATLHDLSQGALTQSGNPLDVALSGEGFFAVRTSQGEAFSRNGTFVLNTEGTLVDQSGNPVLSTAGDVITFSPEEADIMISSTGIISTSQGQKAALRLVEFENPQLLIRLGDSLFTGSNPLPATSTRAMQGFIERSNVSGVAEMTEIIRVTRSYENLTNLMQKQDELRRNAIQRLGDSQA